MNTQDLPQMTVQVLREKMRQLPEPPEAQPPYWDYWRMQLRKSVLANDPTTFMTWPVVRHTMLMSHLPITKSWDIIEPTIHSLSRYETAILPPRYATKDDMFLDKYSRSMIEQCAHVDMWERWEGERINALHSIFEFGGGFGAMALLANRLGFTGKYTIFDYPEMVLFQQWFLEKHGIYDVEFITDMNDVSGAPDLLIAIDSISETPMEYRAKLWKRIQPNGFIFRYSPQWADYDNEAYFDNFAVMNKIKAYKWEATGWVSHSMVG